MNKQEIYVLLDQMCREMAIIEASHSANVSKDFILNLVKLVEIDDILDIIIERMEKEEVPLLDSILCNLVNIDEIHLTEKQMKKLVSITRKHVVYAEDDVIYCIIKSAGKKLPKSVIKKIALTLEHNADDFFASYIDYLWDNIFKEDLTEQQKDEARRIYEETKDWFFDEGWL